MRGSEVDKLAWILRELIDATTELCGYEGELTALERHILVSKTLDKIINLLRENADYVR